MSRNTNKKQIILQFFKFSLVGVTNVLISYAINLFALWGLKNFELQYDYMIANIIAFALSVLWSFLLNYRYVFDVEEKGCKSILYMLAKMYMSYAFTGIILNNVLSLIWIDKLAISKIIAPLLNVPITVPVNFLVIKFWVYKNKNNKDNQKQ